MEKNERSKDNLFQIENDGKNCLIVGYKGFEDKKIVIPSSINGRWGEDDFSIDRWIGIIGGSKAEGYAYTKDRFSVKNEIRMNKYYTHEEAMRIQNKLQYNRMRVDLFDYWGKSEV